MANPVPVIYTSPVPKVAGGKWFSRTAGVSAFVETGNVDAAQTVIVGATGAEPQIALKPYGTYHIHWLFQILDCAGKRPVFTVDDTHRYGGDFHSTFRPVYSYDGETWVKAPGFTQLATPRRTVFQFGEIFTQDAVFVADQQAWMLARSDELAQSLLADTTGRVFVSSAANEQGVIGITPIEARAGFAVGQNPIYGFRLTAETPPVSGGRRRLLLTSGIHSGEVLDGWILRSIINTYRSGVGAKADALRANWEIFAYFNISPNARKAGNYRLNPTRAKDPNRDWGSEDGLTPFWLAESVIVRDAILSDVTSVHAHIDCHSSAGFTYETSINNYPEAGTAMLDAYKLRFDAQYPVPLDPKPAVVANTFGQWSMSVLSSQFSINPEPGMARHKSVDELTAAGVAFAGALTDLVTDGLI